MRPVVWNTIFFLLIFTVIFVLTRGLFTTEKLYEDDDQEGLNEQIVIRFSHVVAENTPKGLAAQRFAEIAHEKTNGRVRVEVFPNGSLFSDREEFSALLQNDIQMIAPSFSMIAEFAPEWAVFDLPFLFHDLAAVERAFVGEIGEHLLQRLDRKGVQGLAFWNNGFKQMTSFQNPLIYPEDFKGQGFRVMPSWVIYEQFKLLNAKPVEIPFNEVYNSLESFDVDGQENTISNIYSRRLYELQRYMTISNHGLLGYAVIINRDFWNSLPEDNQLQLTEAMIETTGWNAQNSKRMNSELLKQLEKNVDIEIHYLTEEEKKSWIEALQPVYQVFKEKSDNDLIELVEKLHVND
ncbi:DctP family TRAP transporter solute-binding subunit [Bacillus sp. B15-48]|nr:DctP family TRAP transporter solute-binding subunit [Bacillus sp. B15-48]